MKTLVGTGKKFFRVLKLYTINLLYILIYYYNYYVKKLYR